MRTKIGFTFVKRNEVYKPNKISCAELEYVVVFLLGKLLSEVRWKSEENLYWHS
jgi:hypothetical protein